MRPFVMICFVACFVGCRSGSDSDDNDDPSSTEAVPSESEITALIAAGDYTSWKGNQTIQNATRLALTNTNGTLTIGTTGTVGTLTNGAGIVLLDAVWG